MRKKPNKGLPHGAKSSSLMTKTLITEKKKTTVKELRVLTAGSEIEQLLFAMFNIRSVWML